MIESKNEPQPWEVARERVLAEHPCNDTRLTTGVNDVPPRKHRPWGTERGLKYVMCDAHGDLGKGRDIEEAWLDTASRLSHPSPSASPVSGSQEEIRWEYKDSGGLYLTWANPFNEGIRQDLAMFLWPTHAPAVTKEVEAKYEDLASRIVAALRLTSQHSGERERARDWDRLEECIAAVQELYQDEHLSDDTLDTVIKRLTKLIPIGSSPKPEPTQGESK